MDIKASAAIVLLALSGCAMLPQNQVPATATAVQASMVPPQRMMGFLHAGKRPAAQLVITRDAGLLGAGCYYSVYINELFAARMDAAETASFVVPAGKVVVKIGRDPYVPAFCNMGYPTWVQGEAVLAEGARSDFLLSIDRSGKTALRRVDRSK